MDLPSFNIRKHPSTRMPAWLQRLRKMTQKSAQWHKSWQLKFHLTNLLGLAAVGNSCEGNWKTSLLWPVTSSKVPGEVYFQRRYKANAIRWSPKQSEFLIIQNVQCEAYKQEISCLNNSDGSPKTSTLLKLSPMVDNDGLVRVGGRLQRASLSYEESHPLGLPGSRHISSLLIKHYHEKVQHQG